MNLVIDVGNTLVKLAVFQLDEVVFKDGFEQDYFLKKILLIKKKYPLIKDVIVGSSGKLSEVQLKCLETNFSFTRLSNELKLPFKNLYKTPKTLGVDRLALMASASNKYTNTNVLVIDSGTCITYDFINAQNEYLGGAISLGLNMRYEALQYFTQALPLLEKKNIKHFVGDSTETCIHSGVVNGLIQEIQGVINQYTEEYEDLTIILTGGDANFLSKPLKSSIFVNSNFLLEGLNYLLNYNLK